MKNATIKKSERKLKVLDLGVDVYNCELSSLSLDNDPTVIKRTEEARQFLLKVGLPDFDSFRKR